MIVSKMRDAVKILWIGLWIGMANLSIVSAEEAPQESHPPKTGAYTATFTQRSPHSSFKVLADRMGLRRPASRGSSDEYDITQETFEVYVPRDYSPDEPCGLLVWINAIDHGRAFNHYQPVLDRHRLIWVGANRSGNNHETLRRAALALDGAYNILQRYVIDPDRVYASGYSGGTRVASMLAPTHPDVFSGAAYLLGCNKPKGAVSKEAKEQMRFVHVTSDGDFNLEDTRNVHAYYVNSKFRHATLIELENLGHDLPNADGFEAAILPLDKPLRDSAPKWFKTAKKLDKRSRFGDAWDLYVKAAKWGGDEDFVTEAQTRAAAIVTEYDEQVQQARGLIEDKKYVAARALLSRLKRQYTHLAEQEVPLLLKQARPGRPG